MTDKSNLFLLQLNLIVTHNSIKVLFERMISSITVVNECALLQFNNGSHNQAVSFHKFQN